MHHILIIFFSFIDPSLRSTYPGACSFFLSRKKKMETQSQNKKKIPKTKQNSTGNEKVWSLFHATQMLLGKGGSWKHGRYTQWHWRKRFLPFPPVPVAKGFLVRSGTFCQLPLSVLGFCQLSACILLYRCWAGSTHLSAPAVEMEKHKEWKFKVILCYLGSLRPSLAMWIPVTNSSEESESHSVGSLTFLLSGIQLRMVWHLHVFWENAGSYLRKLFLP